MTKDHVFREVRKLVDVLEKWGNCLVPSIYEDGSDTHAKDRLEWLVALAKEEHGMSIEDIEKGIKELM